MTCPKCRHTAGWLEDAETGLPVRRCDCMMRGEFHAAAVGDAHPQALDAAVRIIRDAAHARATFSSNDIRDQLNAAQIPGPVVGAAFAKCARDGMIRASGDYVASTQAETHGHPVKCWQSRIYRGSAA